MKSPVHHVIYLCNMRRIVHVHIFISNEAHLLIIPEWLQAFKTMTSGVPIQQGQAGSSHITYELPLMPYMYASQVDSGS